MYSQECGKFLLLPQSGTRPEGLDSDAAKTIGRRFIKEVVTESNLPQISLAPSLFIYQSRKGGGSPKRCKNMLLCFFCLFVCFLFLWG